MKKGKIGIHTENLLPIIKKWLYSEHDIFLRELVSNAFDAISKLKHLSLIEEFNGIEPDYCITISTNQEKKTLTIEDNGLGLTEEEIEKYISQVAFSGAKDFVKKYEQAQNAQDLIGFFGLGFYSAFMVAHTVEIQSLSYKSGSEGVFWKSTGDEEYEMDKCIKSTIGTSITLYLNDDSEEFLQDTTLVNTIKKYSQFLPVTIVVNGVNTPQQESLWKKNPSDVTEEEYSNLFKALFPEKTTDPSLHFHIKTDYPFEAQGIFYFPTLQNQMDPAQGNIKLFVKDVFVADKLQLVPEYLSPILGVIESNDIPLNVSRSQMQGDIRIRKIASHIESKFIDRIIQMFKDDRNQLEKIWKDLHIFIKFGCMHDQNFFEKMKDYVLFETTDSKLMTLKEYQESNPNLPKNNDKTTFFYTDRATPFSQYKNALEESNITAIVTEHSFDSHFFSYIEGKDTTIQFARIDSELNNLSYNTTKTLSKEEEDKIIDTFKKLLSMDELIYEVKEIKNQDQPAMLVTNEQMRRFTEMSSMMQQNDEFKKMSLVGKSLIINPSNKLVQKILLIEPTEPEKAKQLAHQILDLTALDTGNISEERRQTFIKRSFNLLDTIN